MDSLELKVPKEDLDAHLRSIRHTSPMDKADKPLRQSKMDKASKENKEIRASEGELQVIKSRNKKRGKDQDRRPESGNKGSKYTSNKTHYGSTDPDARISVKPGKARKLNYMSQLSVDTGHHVITDIRAYHADKKDNQYLEDITNRLKPRLHKQGLLWHNLLADTGYSNGENYALLEQEGLRSFIPPHGTYKDGPENFVYNKLEDHYVCPEGNIIPFKKVFLDYKIQTKKKEYRSSSKTCKGCQIALQYLGKTAKEKKFSVTYYRAAYERNNKRVNSRRGKYMKGKRQSTVEPVFGTFTQFMGLRKTNTIGIEQANKVMHLSAMAYNLKKYLKFTTKTVKSNAKAVRHFALQLKVLFAPQIRPLPAFYF